MPNFAIKFYYIQRVLTLAQVIENVILNILTTLNFIKLLV